jgi:hypothetical protein
MIAAYVIGFPVTKEYLANNPHLKFAKDSVDTGEIISYNTESSVMTGINPLLYGLVITAKVTHFLESHSVVNPPGFVLSVMYQAVMFSFPFTMIWPCASITNSSLTTS